MSCKADVGTVVSVRPTMFYGTCERNPESNSCANTGFIPKHGFQNYFKILLAND